MEMIVIGDGTRLFTDGAGIGGERYVPPDPMIKRPADIAAGNSGRIVIGAGVEEAHRAWVETQGWRTAGETAVAAVRQEL